MRSVDSRPKLLYFPSAIHSSALPSAWFEWLANEEDNENREKMIPRNHCARTFQRLSPNVSHCAKSSNPRLAPFDEKSASHVTDLNYDCHTSCVSFREMMKGRINSIRCVFHVTNRSRIRSFASFMAECTDSSETVRNAVARMYRSFYMTKIRRSNAVQLPQVYRESAMKNSTI